MSALFKAPVSDIVSWAGRDTGIAGKKIAARITASPLMRMLSFPKWLQSKWPFRFESEYLTPDISILFQCLNQLGLAGWYEGPGSPAGCMTGVHPLIVFKPLSRLYEPVVFLILLDLQTQRYRMEFCIKNTWKQGFSHGEMCLDEQIICGQIQIFRRYAAGWDF